jgi:hypothetical protein
VAIPRTEGSPHIKAIRRTIRLLTTSGIAIASLEAGACFSLEVAAFDDLDAVTCFSFLGAVVWLGFGSGGVFAFFLRFWRGSKGRRSGDGSVDISLMVAYPRIPKR